MSQTMLYIGAGHHFEPVKTFAKQCKKFVFIDSRPLTEQGKIELKEEYYDHGFIKWMIRKFEEQYGFKHISSEELLREFEKEPSSMLLYPNPMLWKFTKGDIVVHYYTSVLIPDHLNKDIPQLKQDISETTSLIVSGFHPSGEIFKYVKSPIDFIGYLGTWYPKDYTIYSKEKFKGDIFDVILQGNIKNYFKSFFLVREKMHEVRKTDRPSYGDYYVMEKCSDIILFDNYEDFCDQREKLFKLYGDDEEDCH